MEASLTIHEAEMLPNEAVVAPETVPVPQLTTDPLYVLVYSPDLTPIMIETISRLPIHPRLKGEFEFFKLAEEISSSASPTSPTPIHVNALSQFTFSLIWNEEVCKSFDQFYAFLSCLRPQYITNHVSLRVFLPIELLKLIQEYTVGKKVYLRVEVQLNTRSGSEYPFTKPEIRILKARNIRKNSKVLDENGYYQIPPVSWPPSMSLYKTMQMITAELENENIGQLYCDIIYQNNTIRNSIVLNFKTTTVLKVLEILENRIKSKRFGILPTTAFHLLPLARIENLNLTLIEAGFGDDCSNFEVSMMTP